MEFEEVNRTGDIKNIQGMEILHFNTKCKIIRFIREMKKLWNSAR